MSCGDGEDKIVLVCKAVPMRAGLTAKLAAVTRSNFVKFTGKACGGYAVALRRLTDMWFLGTYPVKGHKQ